MMPVGLGVMSRAQIQYTIFWGHNMRTVRNRQETQRVNSLRMVRVVWPLPENACE